MTDIQSLFHPDLNLVAYRIKGLECLPVQLDREEPADQPIQRQPQLILPLGGALAIPGVGFIRLDRGGLYRIHSMANNQCFQWIVHDGDPLTLAASVSAIFYHHADEPADAAPNTPEGLEKTYQYFLANAPKGKVAGTCLTASHSFAFLCRQAGIDAVVWQFENLSAPYGEGASHAMTEIRLDDGTGRALVDIDRNALYDDGEGTLLACADFVHRARQGEMIGVRPLTRACHTGLGLPGRIPQRRDFINELADLAGPAFQAQVAALVGQSHLILGMRQYGDECAITLPGQTDYEQQALTGTARENLGAGKLKMLELQARLPAEPF